MDEFQKMTICDVSAERAPMELLLEADPSEEKVRAYLEKSHCYVAKIADKIVGAFVLCRLSSEVVELLNIVVAAECRQKGIGAKILSSAVSLAKQQGFKVLEVGTGTFGYQLAFYQRAGFRVFAIDKDYFVKNYREPIYELGIQLKDMLRLRIDLSQPSD